MTTVKILGILVFVFGATTALILHLKTKWEVAKKPLLFIALAGMGLFIWISAAQFETQAPTTTIVCPDKQLYSGDTTKSQKIDSGVSFINKPLSKEETQAILQLLAKKYPDGIPKADSTK